MSDIDKLWISYTKNRDSETKDKLILEYTHLIKYVAGKLIIHIGHHVEFDDLLSYGIFGLIDAIDKFDVKKGAKFETYASLRIKGAIIDSIRKLDWVPRTLRQKNKELDKLFSELEAELGREPTDEELAKKLDIPVSEVGNLLKNSSVASLISLDDYLDQNHEIKGIVNDNNENPANIYEKEELHKLLTDSIDKLTEKEKRVITLYYFEDLTLKEISLIMGVSESRISQIHSKSVLRLQAKLGKYKSVLFN